MSTQNNRIGLEFISFFNMAPVDMVECAADLGCRHISLALEPMHTSQINYAPWSLRDDKQLRRDLLQAMKDRHVDISMGECYMIKPGADFRVSAQHDLEIMRELNIKRVNIVSLDQDFSHNVDQCGALVEMASALGLETTLEFGPYLGISNLQSALSAVEAVNSPNFRLVIDAMHFFRSGSTAADLAKLNPDLIGYLQLCDVPTVCPYEHYMYEARYERLAPGEGTLPLRDLLQAAPRDVIVGLEIPMLAQAKAGVDARERMRGAVAATQELLRALK